MRSQPLLFWTLDNCLHKLSALNTEQFEWKSFVEYQNVKMWKYKKPGATETFCLALNYVLRNNFCFSTVTCIDLMELNSELALKLSQKRFSIFMWLKISFRWIYLKKKLICFFPWIKFFFFAFSFYRLLDAHPSLTRNVKLFDSFFFVRFNTTCMAQKVTQKSIFPFKFKTGKNKEKKCKVNKNHSSDTRHELYTYILMIGWYSRHLILFQSES